MKKLVVLLFFVTTVCSAQMILQKNELGEYRIDFISENNWENTGIIIEDGAQYFIRFFPQAIAQPDNPILVETSKKFLKLQPIFKKLEAVNKQEIVYYDSIKTISFIESNEEQVSSSYLISFSIISLLFIIIANIFLSKDYDSNPALVVHALALIFSLAALGSIKIISFADIFLALATLTIIFGFSGHKHGRKAGLAIYYSLMIIYFILLFV